MAEMMIVATIIAHRATMWSFRESRDYVSPEEFYFPFPGAVYAAILRVTQYAGFAAISFAAVQHEVERVEGNRFSEHFPVLYQLLGFGRESRDEVPFFARRIRNLARHRQLEYMLLGSMGYFDREPVSVVQDIQRRLADLVEGWDKPKVRKPPEDELEQMLKKAYAQGKLVGRCEA